MPDDKATFAFKWTSTLPDQRQYKQNSQVLEPVDAMVYVEVPVESRYIHNAEAIKVSILDGKAKQPKAILTPEGMAYCVEQLEKFFLPAKEVTPNTFKANEAEDDWEAGETETASSNEGWDEESTDKPTDEKWEESDEDWESENDI